MATCDGPATDREQLIDARAEIDRLTELAYAPDSKEHRSMVFEEAAKRLPLEEEIERLRAALLQIRDTAYSPQGDDWIWMDDQTPLGQFVDVVLQCGPLGAIELTDNDPNDDGTQPARTQVVA